LTNQQPPSNFQRREETALAHRPAAQGWTDPDWQRLWLTLDHLQWRTLALVPGGPGASLDFTLNFAVTLSRTGMSHVGAPILVADGTQVPLDQLNAFLADVRACCDGGERVIIALSACADSPTTAAMARSADGALLCVLMGKMTSGDCKQTIKAIGAPKFFGSVIIRPNGTHAG